MSNILVNKPQFDTEALAPGTAISIYTNSYNFDVKRGQDVNAIVISITPLEMRVVFAFKQDYLTEVFKIDDVVKEEVKITLLEKVKSEEATK
ncbi:hypothetical protein MOD72_12175 [Bacillus haynesii]|uniref:hypothetical protein n=1 Tax=Bacillus haynesii TaxID=1925021 RepID=UPI002281DC2A|nr:hypothetical protein [Bacillus haynesii]MCY8609934.1 hypothetical protein [Bacillus haynesii]MEC0752169.1 hypothetical protein [Bacillus haynesii]